MIAQVLGKKGWIKFGYFNIYPNLYVILASQPGVGKKSTAIDIASAIIRDSEATPYFSNDNQSSQALIGEMEKSEELHQYGPTKFYKHSSLTVIADELVSLLSQGGPMVDFLTTIYSKDKEFEYKTKNMGRNKITNPCLNILAGVTTETLNSRVVRDATAGGLISRCDIIYDNNVRPSSMMDTLSSSQLEARERVVTRMTEVAALFGEFTLTKEAVTAFRTYEFKEDKAMRENPMNAEFRSRKPTKTIKVAMLLAASELKMVIDETMIQIAIAIMDRVEHNMKFIHMASGTHKNAAITSKVIGALGALNDAIQYEQLIEHFMGDATQQEIDDAIGMLLKVGYVEQKQVVFTDGEIVNEILLTSKGKEVYRSI